MLRSAPDDKSRGAGWGRQWGCERFAAASRPQRRDRRAARLGGAERPAAARQHSRAVRQLRARAELAEVSVQAALLEWLPGGDGLFRRVRFPDYEAEPRALGDSGSPGCTGVLSPALCAHRA